MKKILLTLGSLAAVVAPVAAVVACGSSNTDPGYTGGQGSQTDEGKAIDKMMAGYDSQSPYEHFALNADFIGNRFFNSETTGIAKNVTRTNWFKDTSAFLGFGHESKRDSSTSTKVVNATKEDSTLQEVIFTKKDIISKADFFETKLASLNLDSAKQYVYSVTSTKADNLKNEGEFKISIWESKPQSAKLTSAIDVLKNDFDFNEQSIKEISGTYLFSQPHMFTLGGSTFGLEGLKTSSQHQTYNDRASDDNLVDWTGFGPKAALTQTQKDALKDTVIMAKVITDNNTKEQNVQLTIRDKTGNSQTIYIPTRKIAELNEVGAFDQNEFSDVWKQKMQFQPVYNLFSKLKGQVGQLADLGMSGMLDYVIRVSSKINLLASTYDFSNTDSFIKAFGAYLTADSDFNEKAMLNAMKNVTFAEFDHIDTLGSKGYVGLYWLERTYSEFEKFIKSSQSSHPEWVVKTINSPSALNTVLINEANKAKTAEAGKVFLAAHKPAVPFAGLSNDDIISLVNKTKAADNKAAVDALKAVVSAFKTNFDASEDKTQNDGYHDYWSKRSGVLAKFIDDNAKTIFGLEFNGPDLSVLSSQGKYYHTFEAITKKSSFAYDMKQHGKISGYTVSSFVSDVIKPSISQKQFDALQASLLTPLGIVS